MDADHPARIGVFVLTLALTLALALGGASAQDQTTLTVSVVDQDGDPVGGVDVEATWEATDGDEQTATGTTASNGKVFIDVEPGADVELDVDDDEYVRNRPLEVDDATESDVELEVSQSGTVSVDVVDGRDRSQSDARVRIRDGGRLIDSGETDSTGRFDSDRLERDTYDITVVKPGYFETTRSVRVTDGTDVTVTLDRGTVTVEVRVVDDHFDPPVTVEAGTVSAASETYSTEASVTDGEAALNVPVNDEYTIEASVDGYTGDPTSVEVDESMVETNVSVQRTPMLAVERTNERVVVGETTRMTVTNAYDEPVEGASIEVDGAAVGETDDDGEVDVPIDEAGERRVVATADGVTSDPVTIQGVEPGSDGASEGETSEDTTDGDGETTDTDDSVPGFGVTGALLAVILLVAVATTRRRRRR